MHFDRIGLGAIIEANGTSRATLSDVFRGNVPFSVHLPGRSQDLLRAGGDATAAALAFFNDDHWMRQN
jgi:hypothetical protein